LASYYILGDPTERRRGGQEGGIADASTEIPTYQRLKPVTRHPAPRDFATTLAVLVLRIVRSAGADAGEEGCDELVTMLLCPFSDLA
jgi:hypothetical protein